MDKITSGRCYLHIQPSENDVDEEETKLPVCNPIMSLCKPDCVRGLPSLPSWSKENLKTGKTFLLSTHVKMQENLPSFQLLRHDIESERRSWAKLPLHGEFSYKPLYWEWLEDILVRWKDKLTTLHLFDALYALLFLYDRCSNLIRAVCEYWCLETTTLHTSKGEVSLSIFDIYSFLGLPISGHLYDKELASKLPLSCTYLFIAYHKLMQGRKGKPTIEQWISFWFRGRSKYHAIFDELGVATRQRTETFLAAFLSCWLCTFILPVRDAGCIRPGTFSIASLITSGVGYCLHTAVIASIYKGLNELSRSSHPGRSGGHFPTYFLYAWLAKNFDAYELVGEASSSPGIVKFSGLGRTKSFQPEEARKLIGFGRGFCWHSSIINRLKETLVDDGKLSRADFAYFDVPIDLDFDNLPDPEAMLRYYHILMRCGTGSQVLLLGRCNLLERNTTRTFREWWPKMSVSLPCSPHASGFKRKCSDLSDTNISKDEGKLKPKLKIVYSGKPVEPFVPAIEDGSSRVKIPGIDVGTSAMPFPAIPIQSIAPLPQPSTQKVIELPLEGAENIMDILDAEPNPVECMEESDDVNFKEGLAHVPLPLGSQCFPSVGRIPSFDKDLFDSRSGLVNSRGVCPPDDDEVESIRRANAHSSVPRPQCPLKEVDKNAARVLRKAILDKVCLTSFDGLPSLRGDFDSLYTTILQRGVDVIALESKVEACDFKDLQQSYSGRISAEEHNNCHMEVQGKLDEASRRLNTEGTHYEAKAAELKHVESRRQELLKELQLLEDQQKELSSQGQIEVLNATEMMDAATKASLEKAESYIKESFEDLKNFQWDP
ncbi:hypothetical protein Cgig2_004606 [Carnegiea gigantea]|uniref:Aminotransferase-like plant mobile domain-containing protein n=1 Tax=Carnegiea gigantea TaxID=171969 RepID=A0A9Q1JZQ8_9CARY|nr:hypothetical protein Cgig2_004606 [Carnegiea gigantea]